MEITYKHILAIVIVVVVAWIILIMYRVGREKAIKKVDFWKAKWKIVLFWMIVLAIIGAVFYFLSKYNLIGE